MQDIPSDQIQSTQTFLDPESIWRTTARRHERPHCVHPHGDNDDIRIEAYLWTNDSTTPLFVQPVCIYTHHNLVLDR